MTLVEELQKIGKLDEAAMMQCKHRWDSIAKPLNSLGKLESYLVQIAGITGSSLMKLDKKVLVVMCADNGVVEEGVTQTGQEVTAIVAENFLSEQATASILCSSVGADIYPVDIGIARDTKIINRKILYGTGNMTKGPSMSRTEAIRALETGISITAELKKKGYSIIATGEMGIGNTTTSSAVAAVLTGAAPRVVTGRGAGLSSAGLRRKIDAIERAIEINRPIKEDAIDVLAKVGGLDIAGMAGVFLGGAVHKIPVVIDGFISSVAALAAIRICPEVKGYMIPSHVSKEPASKMILEEMQMEAALTCDMCLGEGTGAVTLFPILDMACAVYNRMSTFEDIDVDEYEPFEQ